MVSQAYAVQVAGSEVLSRESCQRGGKTGGGHPRDRLYLGAHALHGNPDMSPLGRHGGQSQGEHGE